MHLSLPYIPPPRLLALHLTPPTNTPWNPITPLRDILDQHLPHTRATSLAHVLEAPPIIAPQCIMTLLLSLLLD